MELNFDKEIDAILRKAQSEPSAVADGLSVPHLDADEISAFAENALPEKAKMRYTAHLADCDKCRKTLSNLILLNGETESEIVHANKNLIAAPAIPWYRKLFVFPNLAYSLGALVLVFGGLIGFTVLQSLNLSDNATISQVSNKTIDTKSAPAQSSANSASNMSNASTANTTVPANSVYQSNTAAPHSSMNTNTSAATPPPIGSADKAPGDDRLTLAKTEADSPVVTDEKEVREEQKRAEVLKDNEDVAKLSTEQKPAPSTSGALNTQVPKAVKRKSDSANTGETASSGGKTFRRSNNVWYDTAYSNQPTTNVTRGSGEYKKLDSGLRSIVQNLGGTVVIVWKNKAYRIQ